MYLSVDNLGAFPSSVVAVWLDGVQQFHCLEVDSEPGKSYIVRYKPVDPSNPRKGCVVDPVSGEFIRERVEGKVVIKW